MKIIMIVKEDIKLFPPILTIIQTVLKCGYELAVIGHYSDAAQKKELQEKGVSFFDTGYYDLHASQLSKLKATIGFRSRVKNIIKSLRLEGNDYRLWIFQGITIGLLHDIVGQHPTILHPFEFVGKKVKFTYRVLSPFYKPAKTFKKAFRVVSCEYNRAHIMKGLFGLEEMPVVLPNKLIINEDSLSFPPDDIRERIEDFKVRLGDRKAILYQGIFLPGERKLDSFCDAVATLGHDFAMVVMGNDDQEGYRQLKFKYGNDNRILFVPFIRPPYHLLVTRLCHIGVLSYFPQSYSLAAVINPLYCAPNKIFEYGKYGLPMIGNDIPGLHYPFLEFNCGETIDYPMSPQKIKSTVTHILENYKEYSQGAKNLYDSVNIEATVRQIID